MKNKHKIETIDDIKYCEEHGLTIYSDTWEPDFFKFTNGVWCMYSDNELKIYHTSFDISYDELYYYEEQEQQEATEKDIGKLCYFWNAYDKHDKTIALLKGLGMSGDDKRFYADNIAYYRHCCPLSPSEVAEITGYKVEEK